MTTGLVESFTVREMSSRDDGVDVVAGAAAPYASSKKHSACLTPISTHVFQRRIGYDATKPIESLPNLLQQLFKRVSDLEKRVAFLEKLNQVGPPADSWVHIVCANANLPDGCHNTEGWVLERAGSTS